MNLMQQDEAKIKHDFIGSRVRRIYRKYDRVFKYDAVKLKNIAKGDILNLRKGQAVHVLSGRFKLQNENVFVDKHEKFSDLDSDFAFSATEDSEYYFLSEEDIDTQQEVCEKTRIETRDKIDPRPFKYDKEVSSEQNLSNFKVLKELGKGSWGAVYLAYHKATKMLFAIKKIKKEMIRNKDYLNNLINEINAFKHSKMNKCDYFMDYYGIVNDSHHFYQIFEYLEGADLEILCTNYRLFRKLGESKYSDNLIRLITRKTFEALWFMNLNFYMHRDIKPGNVILTSEGDIVLIDFGNARKVKKDERAFTLVGTPLYLAPEVLKGEYSLQADYFSFGVMLYEFFTYDLLFQHKDVRNVNDIYKEIGNFRPDAHEKQSLACKKLIKFTQSYPNEGNLLRLMLEPKPERRVKNIVPVSIINHNYFKQNDLSFDYDKKGVVERLAKDLNKIVEHRNLSKTKLNDKIVQNLMNYGVHENLELQHIKGTLL